MMIPEDKLNALFLIDYYTILKLSYYLNCRCNYYIIFVVIEKMNFIYHYILNSYNKT